jgi:hypothetical protein
VLPDGLGAMVERDGVLAQNSELSTSDLGVKIKFYPSENLIYRDNEMMIFAEYIIRGDGLAGAVGTAGAVLTKLCYRVLTKTTSFLYDPTGQSEAEKYSEYLEIPNRDEIPAGVLGGRWIPRVHAQTGLDISYFESDFSFAIPTMDKLNTVDNQHAAITCTSVFSTTVIREVPCQADGCKKGRVKKKDADGGYITDNAGDFILETCKSCSGTGMIDLSALNVIVAPRANSLNPEDKPIALSDYIHHDTPDTSAVQELGNQVKANEEKVDRALTILQQKVVGQSAESKEADMQDKQTFLANIALSLARIAQNILRWSAYIVLDGSADALNAEVEAINVAAPKTFNIMTIEALRQMRDENRAAKSLDTRALETLKLVEKESDNPMQIRLYELLHKYTQNRSEALAEELNAWLDYEIIDKKQYLEALFAGAEIKSLLAKNPEITEEQAFAALDKKFADMVKKSELASKFAARETPPQV